jgi:N-acetylmuramoyl-L-alanine amidase
MRYFKHLACSPAIFLMSAFLLIVSPMVGAVTINDARIWSSPDNTRVVFDTTGEVEHIVFTLAQPDRVVVDIKNSSLKLDWSTLDLAGSPIRKIRHANKKGGDLRLVFDLSEPSSVKSFVLEPNNQYGHRLVIDLTNNSESSKQDSRPTMVSKSGDRDIVIAIDAGHGGEDPGAIGPSGVREKDIVFAMAQELKKEVDKNEGYRGVLIRTGDYYIDLVSRTHLARRSGADLMVSIHADAFDSPRPKGASVFALSQSGATSETAKWLANKENRSDLIGGAGPLSLSDKNGSLAGVLLDLSMTSSINTGIGIGTLVLDELKLVTKLHKKRVEQAGFAVLKSPDIPSILVESGFISNPGEEKKLSSKYHQKKIVKALFKGISNYFKNSPPPGTLVESRLKRDGQFANLR